MKKFMEFLKDEGGQTSTEYILLVAVAAMLVFKFKGTAEREITKLTEGVFEKAGGILEDIN